MTNSRFSVVNSLWETKAAKSGKAIGGHVSPLRIWARVSESSVGAWEMERERERIMVRERVEREGSTRSVFGSKVG